MALAELHIFLTQFTTARNIRFDAKNNELDFFLNKQFTLDFIEKEQIYYLQESQFTDDSMPIEFLGSAEDLKSHLRYLQNRDY